MGIRLLFLIIIMLLLDWYTFQAFKTTFRSHKVNLLFWFISIIAILSIAAAIFSDVKEWPKPIKTYLFAFIFVIYICKVFLVIFILIDDIIRLGRWIYSFFENKGSNTTGSISISRSEFLMKFGLIITAIPFLALINGMFTGAFDYTVRKVQLSLAKLPKGFKGFKMVQISDLHLGSFVNTSPVETIVKIINEQKPDIVFFTGDLVNNEANEAQGFVSILKKIKAPLGVFSVLGNHDYGDYVQWSTKEEKLANHNKLLAIQKELGWRLLLNENVELERAGDKISLIGIENWGAYGHFSRYGKLDKAMENLAENPVNILLSHDPSHWTEVISKKHKNIDLTLSGHTHGMQFGIEIGGFKWSPVKYFYKNWAGLYQSNNQYLYVNRGLGFLGYPGRVGILPEITVIELV